MEGSGRNSVYSGYERVGVSEFLSYQYADFFFCIIAVTMAAYIVFVRKTITRPTAGWLILPGDYRGGKFENRENCKKTGDEIEALKVTLSTL